MNSQQRPRLSLPSERLEAARNAAASCSTRVISTTTIRFRVDSMNWAETILWRTAGYFAHLATWLRQEVVMSQRLRNQRAIDDAIREYRGRARS